MATGKGISTLCSRRIFPESYVDQFRGDKHPYLDHRGIAQASVEAWGIGFDTSEDAITIPVRDAWGNCVGIIWRYLDGTPKYRYNPGFEVKHSLLGIHNPMLRDPDEITLVEGPLDAILVSQAGIGMGMAVFGSHLHQGQINALEFAGFKDRHISVMFDNDKAGDAGEIDALLKLQTSGFSAQILPYSRTWRDPADLMTGMYPVG